VTVVAGETVWVPPVAVNVYVVLSMLSEITTWVALLAVTVRVTAVPGATVAEFAATVTTGLDAGAGLGPGDAGALPQAVVAERAMRAIKLSKAGQKYRKDSFRISPTIQRNVRSGIGKLHDECGPKMR